MSVKLHPAEIQSGLRQFTGTDHYYRYMAGLKLTDGAKWLADAAQCYWLHDIIASYNLDPKFKSDKRFDGFQVWKLKVDLDKKSGVVTAEDGNDNVVISQTIEYTDFPLPEITLYMQNDVIHLPSED